MSNLLLAALIILVIVIIAVVLMSTMGNGNEKDEYDSYYGYGHYRPWWHRLIYGYRRQRDRPRSPRGYRHAYPFRVYGRHGWW